MSKSVFVIEQEASSGSENQDQYTHRPNDGPTTFCSPSISLVPEIDGVYSIYNPKNVHLYIHCQATCAVKVYSRNVLQGKYIHGCFWLRLVRIHSKVKHLFFEINPGTFFLYNFISGTEQPRVRVIVISTRDNETTHRHITTPLITMATWSTSSWRSYTSTLIPHPRTITRQRYLTCVTEV